MQNSQENNKIIKNAISAYLLIFLSSVFLFIKENKLINNKFVKNHTKSALFLHILLFINFLIFIHFKFLDIFSVFWIWANIIIADIWFFIILAFMIIWVYKAYSGEEFSLWNFIKIKNKSFLDITKDGNFGEKDKLTLIFSYIPFLGYIIWSKYDKNKEVKNILRFNLFISALITIIFLLWYEELTKLTSLFYIIFIAFVWVNLFAREELINFRLPDIFSPNEKLKFQKALFKYLKYYMTWNFKSFEEVKKIVDEKYYSNELREIEELKNLWDIKINKKLIYIPIVWLITLFSKNTKQKFHIINSLVLNIIFLLFLSLSLLNYFSLKIFIILLFPICFWFWKLYNSYYKMPYIYDLYELFISAKNIFIKSKKDLDEKRKEVKEVKYKVEKSWK